MQEKILARLERCERSNRRMRTALLFSAAAVVALAIAGFATQGEDREEVLPTLRVRELVVLDSQDVVRVRLGGNLPDAVIDGRRLPRGDRAAGLLLYDDTGRERGGYVTFQASGHVALTLDTRERQVALFAAGPEDGVVARVHRADGSDWIEMRAGANGAHLNAGRGGKLVFQEPDLVETEITAFCSDFMDEIREITPPLPNERIVEICGRHMPREACGKCLEAR